MHIGSESDDWYQVLVRIRNGKLEAAKNSRVMPICDVLVSHYIYVCVYVCMYMYYIYIHIYDCHVMWVNTTYLFTQEGKRQANLGYVGDHVLG